MQRAVGWAGQGGAAGGLLGTKTLARVLQLVRGSAVSHLLCTTVAECCFCNETGIHHQKQHLSSQGPGPNYFVWNFVSRWRWV